MIGSSLIRLAAPSVMPFDFYKLGKINDSPNYHTAGTG